VTFTPGARTNWHTHKTRQVLVATQGTGMVQVKDKSPRILRAGDVAEVPPGVVHWHGALAGHLFAHISLIETDGPDNTTWMEPEGDIVSVSRWLDPAALDGFMARLRAAA